MKRSAELDRENDALKKNVAKNEENVKHLTVLRAKIISYEEQLAELKATLNEREK